VKKNLLDNVKIVRDAAMLSKRARHPVDDNSGKHSTKDEGIRGKYIAWRKLVDSEISEITGMTSKQLALDEDLPWQDMFVDGLDPADAASEILRVVEEEDDGDDDDYSDDEIGDIMDKFGINERIGKVKSVDPKPDAMTDILNMSIGQGETATDPAGI